MIPHANRFMMIRGASFASPSSSRAYYCTVHGGGLVLVYVFVVDADASTAAAKPTSATSVSRPGSISR